MVWLVYGIAAILVLSLLSVVYAVGNALHTLGVNLVVFSAICWAYVLAVYLYHDQTVPVKVYNLICLWVNNLRSVFSRWI